MLSTYLNQTAELRRMTGTDAYGTPKYAAEITVPCRFIGNNKQTSGDTSRSKTNGGIYYLEHEVCAGDMLDGCVVNEVKPMVTIGGGIEGYKAVTA